MSYRSGFRIGFLLGALYNWADKQKKRGVLKRSSLVGVHHWRIKQNDNGQNLWGGNLQSHFIHTHTHKHCYTGKLLQFRFMKKTCKTAGLVWGVGKIGSSCYSCVLSKTAGLVWGVGKTGSSCYSCVWSKTAFSVNVWKVF